jgi:hypothetical protein
VTINIGVLEYFWDINVSEVTDYRLCSWGFILAKAEKFYICHQTDRRPSRPLSNVYCDKAAGV